MSDSADRRAAGSSQLGRRSFVMGLSASALAAALTACGEGTSLPATATSGSKAPAASPSAAASTAAMASPQPTAAPAATRAGTSVTATAGQTVGTPALSPGDGKITIFNTGVKLPTDKVTLRWLDGSASPRSTFQQAFFAEYQKAHPNITIAYEQAPGADINRIVGLGIQNGNAHDCFMQPSSVTPGQMVREGWVHALDDMIPNFAAWKSRFPEGVLVEGMTMFGGKVYALPYLSNKQSNLTLYNTAYLQQAGYDPSAKPLTWDEYRAAAKKITEQGKGKYYGMIIGGQQVDQWEGFVSTLAQMAGVPGSTTNAGGFMTWKDGKVNFTSDQMLAAIDLLLAMKADGSVFPGSLSLGAPQARDQFSQGVAGFILQGPFNIPQWQKDMPNFDFGVGSPPVPNGGLKGRLGREPGATTMAWAYAKTKQPEVLGDIFTHFTSIENQKALVAITGGFPPPIMLKASDLIDLGKRERLAYGIFDELLRLAPTPVVRNPDIALVYLEQKRPTPDLGQTIQGLFTGQLKDAKGALKDLEDRSEAELDRAIKAAQAKGAKVSRDDWAFANYDPQRDYTNADYANLK